MLDPDLYQMNTDPQPWYKVPGYLPFVAKDLAGTVQVSCGLLQVVSREDRHLIKKTNL
jgi:hypothetical protein